MNSRVYVMKARGGLLKVGRSVDPVRRAKEIGIAEVVHQTDMIERCNRVEKLAHEFLKVRGRHIEGEWFETTVDEAIEAINSASEQAHSEPLNACPVFIRLDPELKRKLQELADKDRRSLTNYIEVVLVEHVAEKEKRKDRR